MPHGFHYTIGKMVEAGGVGILSVLTIGNLLMFRPAKNDRNDKIAANWNVSGTRTFQPARQFREKDLLLRQLRLTPGRSHRFRSLTWKARGRCFGKHRSRAPERNARPVLPAFARRMHKGVPLTSDPLRSAHLLRDAPVTKVSFSRLTPEISSSTARIMRIR